MRGIVLTLTLSLMLSGITLTHGRAESADDLFKAGKFVEAEKLYAKVVAEDAKNYQATLRLGHLALLSNRFDEAQKWLAKAAELKPEEKSPKSLLAETYYRRDDFEHAATLFAAAGREVKAKQMESFKGLVPYQLEGKTEITRLKFIHTDPLPLVSVKVNESEEVNFLIDTGGGETILDTEFAKKIGAVQSGTERATYGGNTQAETGEGRVNSLTLGDWVIKNVPVHILSTRQFSGAARGKQVDGIIGTVLLYHFISTLDYPNGELILRRRTKESVKQMEQQAAAEKQITMPFWLAGDHLMVAWGSVNKSQPMLMLVDTGLAGGGFVCPQSTIDEVGIKLPEGQGSEGTFGGGKAKIVPFVVEELSLGEAKGQSITAFFGPFPSSLEYGQGFRIGGLVSHQFFRPYALTFDFNGMKLLLRKKN